MCVHVCVCVCVCVSVCVSIYIYIYTINEKMLSVINQEGSIKFQKFLTDLKLL